MRLSLDDVDYHVVKFGLDVYPPIQLGNERTRLNLFYEGAREKWRDLYDQLTAGEKEFRISKGFRRSRDLAGPAVPVDTFVLTPRGPVFAFPLHLPEPAGETGIGESHLERFGEVRRAFFSAVPGRKILRVGLVREVVFTTGTANCSELISGQADWAGAKLAGGLRLHQYRDDRCNVGLALEPCGIRRATQLPIGTRLEERLGFGLKISLDVNNSDVRPLEEADIEDVITRAVGFWPDKVVEYLAAEVL